MLKPSPVLDSSKDVQHIAMNDSDGKLKSTAKVGPVFMQTYITKALSCHFLIAVSLGLFIV